jgi:hypothetical protein
MKQSNEFKTNFWCGVTAEYKKQSDGWWSVHCRDVNGGNEGRWFKHLTECEEFTAEFKLPENIAKRKRSLDLFSNYVMSSTRNYKGYCDGLD